MTPPFTPILKSDTLDAVSALARAADSYRSVLFLVLAQHPETWDLILAHEDLPQLSDAIINAWRKQIGHDEEDQPELEGD